MKVKNALTNVSALRIVASVFGFLAGLGGITHGIGEILQGNVAPGGIIIPSWTQGPIANSMGGDPAMTLIPNLTELGNQDLFVNSFFFAVASLLLTIFTGIAYDIQHRERSIVV